MFRFKSPPSLLAAANLLRCALHPCYLMICKLSLTCIHARLLAGIVEVFYNISSYDYWQSVGWNPNRHLCLQSLTVRDEKASLVALAMSRKRALDSRLFGSNTYALPSDRGFVDLELLKEFYRLYITELLFKRLKDAKGWHKKDAGFSVFLPAPMFAAVVEVLGVVKKEATHILVTVRIVFMSGLIDCVP